MIFIQLAAALILPILQEISEYKYSGGYNQQKSFHSASYTIGVTYFSKLRRKF